MSSVDAPVQALCGSNLGFAVRLELKHPRSPQHFDGVSANANVGDTFAVSRGSHKNFARTTNFDALSNHHLFVTVCDPVLDHPTGGTTRPCSPGWIFASRKKHEL